MSEQDEETQAALGKVADALMFAGITVWAKPGDIDGIHGQAFEKDLHCGLCGLELEGPYLPPSGTPGYVHVRDGEYVHYERHLPRSVHGTPMGPLALPQFRDSKWKPPASVSFDVIL